MGETPEDPNAMVPTDPNEPHPLSDHEAAEKLTAELLAKVKPEVQAIAAGLNRQQQLAQIVETAFLASVNNGMGWEEGFNALAMAEHAIRASAQHFSHTSGTPTVPHEDPIGFA